MKRGRPRTTLLARLQRIYPAIPPDCLSALPGLGQNAVSCWPNPTDARLPEGNAPQRAIYLQRFPDLHRSHRLHRICSSKDCFNPYHFVLFSAEWRGQVRPLPRGSRLTNAPPLDPNLLDLFPPDWTLEQALSTAASTPEAILDAVRRTRDEHLVSS